MKEYNKHECFIALGLLDKAGVIDDDSMIAIGKNIRKLGE